MISLFSTLHSSPGVCVCFLHQHQSSILFGHVACQIPVPCPGIELKAPAVEVRRVNHWTTRKLLAPEFLRAEVVLVHLCTLFSLLTKVPSTQKMLRIQGSSLPEQPLQFCLWRLDHNTIYFFTPSPVLPQEGSRMP